MHVCMYLFICSNTGISLGNDARTHLKLRELLEVAACFLKVRRPGDDRSHSDIGSSNLRNLGGRGHVGSHRHMGSHGRV